ELPHCQWCLCYQNCALLQVGFWEILVKINQVNPSQRFGILGVNLACFILHRISADGRDRKLLFIRHIAFWEKSNRFSWRQRDFKRGVYITS
ncbi:MAG: hypothetical protein AMJ79_13455, partial [Phycisphaerae bacterium SM23_30]